MRVFGYKRVFTGSISMMAVATSMTSGAHAQDASVETATQAEDNVTSGQIIVTARKRDETLLEVPVSISAFSQENLDKAGASNLEDISALAPGFEFNNSSRVTPLIRFRGLEAVVNTPASRTGAVFWDGAYISDGVSILPLFDLDRVEVIKGPQNAFFGRNTFSGAVNFVPAEPSDIWEGRVSGSFSPSDESSNNVTAVIGGPITDTLGIRVAAMTERVGGDYEYGNGDPWGRIDTDAIMGTVVFEPSSSLKVKANAFYVDSKDTISQASQQPTVAAGNCTGTFSGQLRDVVTGQLLNTFTTDLSQSPRAHFCGEFPDFDEQLPDLPAAGRFGPDFATVFFSPSIESATTVPVELSGRSGLKAPGGLGGQYSVFRGNLGLTYTLDNDATISAVVARGEANNYNIFDGFSGDPFLRDVVGFNSFLIGFVRWTRDSFAEVRYASDTSGPLRYMIGLSYYAQDLEQSDLGTLFARKTINVEEGENYGVFGSIDYDITDQLTLSLEGRWNKDTQTIVFNGPTEIMATETPTVENQEQSFSKFMPRVILSYQPTPDLNVYASWSSSNIQGIATNADNYGAAVPGSGISSATVGLFTPVQKLTAYEIGLKHEVNNSLFYSIAGYYFDWKNQVFADLSPNFTPLNQAGDSRILGIDAEATWKATDWLQISANANYNDIELNNFGGAGSIANAILAPGLITGGVQIDAGGQRPRWNPELSGGISTELDLGEIFNHDPGAFLRVDSNYTGSFFVDNFEFNEVKGYWRFNARLGVNMTDNFAVEVYGNNLTNDLSWNTEGGDTASGANRRAQGILPRKREVGFRLIANF
jgi:iron complex outermembrane receptor protein